MVFTCPLISKPSRLFINPLGTVPRARITIGITVTTVWMHYMDANKMQGVKARWELHKNDTCYFKQILETTPTKNKMCTASYLQSQKLSKTNKTCGTLLEKWCSSMDPYTLTCLCWLTSKNLFTSALCRHRMKFGRAMYDRDGWRERKSKKSV